MSPRAGTGSTITAEVARPRGQRKILLGVVVSNRMSKTIVVRVTRLVRHPKYQRVIRQTSAFKAHDETNSAAIGDYVKIMGTRPLSKEKRWRLVEIIRRASTAPPVPGTEPEPLHVAAHSPRRDQVTPEAPRTGEQGKSGPKTS